MKRLKNVAPGLAILLVAAAVRLPALTAGLPYISYVDENHLLHPVVHMIAERTWEPKQYFYPSLPFYLIAATAVAYSPVYAAVHGRPLREDFSPFPPRYYDILEPPELIVLGRLVTLAFSLGIVVLTGLLARRLAGRAAGLFAAWLAALVPALVVRGAIINVNPPVVFFALATLLLAEGAREGARPRRDTILAGLMTGLAASFKYPAVLVCLPVALAVLLSSAPRMEKLRRLVLAGAVSAATLLVCMPALVLRQGEVLHYMRFTSEFYKNLVFGSYWDQAVKRAEWDLPLEHPELGIAFLILTAAGLAVALRDRRWSKAVWGWLIFGAATGVLLAAHRFHPFRNLLSFVPLACVLVSLLYVRIRQRVSRPLWVDLAAAVLPVVLFAPALNAYLRHQLTLEDSREQAIRWLAEHTGPRDRVLMAEELAVLPSRIATLGPGRVDLKYWDRKQNRLPDRRRYRRYRYLVLGDLVWPDGKPKIPADVSAWIHRNYAVQATFGTYGTHPGPEAFRGNGQKIYILKRVPKQNAAGPA